MSLSSLSPINITLKKGQRREKRCNSDKLLNITINSKASERDGNKERLHFKIISFFTSLLVRRTAFFAR
jgi:hypothetical protein